MATWVVSNILIFDFPVLDSKQERGLAWVKVTDLIEPFPRSDGTAICLDTADDRCSKDIVQYLSTNYRSGFEYLKSPNLSKLEMGAMLNLDKRIGFAASCINILVDTTKTRACQVLFVQNAIYPVISDGKHVTQSTSYVFLEVNVYDPVGGGKRGLRYGYLFQENTEMKDSISSHCTIPNYIPKSEMYK